MADPLTILPPEIVLRILEFAPLASLAILTRVSRAWYKFIDEVHQDAIYYAETKTSHPPGAKDFSFLQSTTSFSKFFSGTSSWKDLCRRQTILPRSWDQLQPVTRESIIQVANDAVWRFRPDFKRRFIISTSQAGGVNVTDMDSGCLIWRLPSTLHTSPSEGVRPYAHLEYQDGTAVWDREGDSIEVWKTDIGDMRRGEFRRVAVLPHNCQTRGFQLSFDTLCVVSTEGHGFIYDFKQTPPQLTMHLEIEDNAVGHLDQSEDEVMYSMGTRGYHVYEKASGKTFGALRPWLCTKYYHIQPAEPRTILSQGAEMHGPTAKVFPPQSPRTDRLTPITIHEGPLPRPRSAHAPLEDDEWGAGMLCGDLMAGVSRGGRVFICSDWRNAIRSQEAFAVSSFLIECDSDGNNFDLGGWLSVKDNRVTFEILDRVYVIALNDDGKMQDIERSRRASYSLVTSSVPQLTVPVSFMAMFDDCIMLTYTTLGWRQRINPEDGQQHEPREDPVRIFPTKAIRILSFAPDQTGDSDSSLFEQQHLPTEREQAQTGLLQLLSMLGDELNDEDDDMEAITEEFPDGLE